MECSTIAGTAQAIRESVAGALSLRACIVGCETGVRLADALSQELGLRTNGTHVNRRDKSEQQKCVNLAGLRSVREAVGTEWHSVQNFVDTESLPLVVKPVEGAGSEGVKLCKSKDDAEAHFHLLMNSQRKVGDFGAAVLVQEYLKGKEYVIDSVSQDGLHKTVMVWVYDKRACNGADFVYFGMLPVPSDSAVAKQLIAYTQGVLDALGIMNGPTHGEVMMTEDGPCLVEMNCRSHGGDGYWVPLARALTGGYSQIDATVDAFLDDRAFKMLPTVPPSPFKVSGQEVMLVSMQSGRVVRTPGLDKIRQLRSFVSLECDVAPGSFIEQSVDLFTSHGSVFLTHDDMDVIAEDVGAIRDMEVNGTLFLLEDDVCDCAASSHTTESTRDSDVCELESRDGQCSAC
jgi:biotin carboxylase